MYIGHPLSYEVGIRNPIESKWCNGNKTYGVPRIMSSLSSCCHGTCCAAVEDASANCYPHDTWWSLESRGTSSEARDESDTLELEPANLVASKKRVMGDGYVIKM